jgi:hypothetical protein
LGTTLLGLGRPLRRLHRFFGGLRLVGSIGFRVRGDNCESTSTSSIAGSRALGVAPAKLGRSGGEEVDVLPLAAGLQIEVGTHMMSVACLDRRISNPNLGSK